MPRIREIQSQIGSSGPVQGRAASAQDFGGGIGVAMEGLGKEMTDFSETIQKHEDQLQIADANAKLLDFQEKESIRMEEELKNAQPGDKDFAERFREGYQERLSALGENFNSPKAKAFFEEHAANLNFKLFAGARSAQSQLIGQKVKDDHVIALNKASNAAMRNPIMWQTELKQMNDAIDGYNIGNAEKEPLRRQATENIAEGAIRGYIRTNPDQAEQLLNDGSMDSYISQDQKKQLYGEIRVQRSALKADRLAQKQLNDLAKKERERASEDKFIRGMFDTDESGNFKPINISAKSIALDPDLTPEKKEHLIELLEQRRGKPPVGDSNAFLDTLSKIQRGDITEPDQIYELLRAKKLSWDGPNRYQPLLEELENRRNFKGTIEGEMRNGTIEIAKKYFIKPDAFGSDPVGEFRFRMFYNHMVDTVGKARKENKIPMRELFDPSSPNWVGKDMARFTATDDDRISAQFDKEAAMAKAAEQGRAFTGGGGGPARLPDETPQQYLDRIRKKDGKQ